MNALIIRAIIIVIIVVAITDTILFIRLKNHPEKFTVLNLILVILITVVPIAINFWVHLKLK
jgi:hypothetical protein